MIDLIKLDETSRVPKYMQIIDSIIHNIVVGNAKVGDKMPSINRLSQEFYLSRDTVERAYKVLKKRKVIVSVHGKGTYIARTQLIAKKNILFLVNQLSPYKLKTYNSFLKHIGENHHADIQSYHSDEELFLDLMSKHETAYDYYIVVPHFRSNNLKHTNFTSRVQERLSKIPKEKLIFLDNRNTDNVDFMEIYQDFENDLFEALSNGLEKISKYKMLKLVFPTTSFYPHPTGILRGFRKFCSHYKFNFEIIEEVDQNTKLEKEELYITIEEDDLVNLVNRLRFYNYGLGKDVGVISYNDTPLKQLLGITVVSTNFTDMGRILAEMILANKREQVKNDFDYIERTSI